MDLFLMTAALCFLLQPPTSTEASAGAMDAADAELRDVTSKLVAGIADGQWAAWERYADRELLYTTEFGRTMTKKDLRALFNSGSPSEHRVVGMRVVASRIRGETAVLICDIDDLDGGKGRDMDHYRVTFTYWRVDEHWRLIASQATVFTRGPEEWRCLRSDVRSKVFEGSVGWSCS